MSSLIWFLTLQIIQTTSHICFKTDIDGVFKVHVWSPSWRSRNSPFQGSRNFSPSQKGHNRSQCLPDRWCFFIGGVGVNSQPADLQQNSVGGILLLFPSMGWFIYPTGKGVLYPLWLVGGLKNFFLPRNLGKISSHFDEYVSNGLNQLMDTNG